MKTKLADVALGFVSLLLLMQVLSFAYDHITTGESSASFWQQLGSTFVLAAGTLLLWRASSLRPPAEPLKSFVLLLRTPRTLTAGQLRQAVATSFGVLCGENDKKASSFVTDTSPAFRIRADGYTFLVNNCDGLYINESQNTPENIPNVRLQRVISDHRAWLSADLLEAPESTTSDLVYQRLGRLIAALADKDCVGIYCPETSQLNSWRPTLITHLQGPNPLQAVAELAEVPAVRIAVNDAELQEASHTAASMWPVFVNAFGQRRSDQTFAVKVPFTDGHETEYMWLIVTEISEDAVIGSLDNEPIYLRNVGAGDAVAVPVDRVNDWLYTDGDEMVGGFTTGALTKGLAA